MHLIAVGGSDAGISAVLRARELGSSSEVTVIVADAYPSFSICGIPYYISGEVTNWRNLAHRSIDDPRRRRHAAPPRHRSRRIDVGSRKVLVTDAGSSKE